MVAAAARRSLLFLPSFSIKRGRPGIEHAEFLSGAPVERKMPK
jgi:hypothetical protein